MFKLFKRFWRWLCRTRTRTLTLFFVLLFMVAFTIAVLIISNNGGIVPDSLIYCVFAALVLAIIMSGVITITDIKIGEIELHTKSKEENESTDDL